MTAAEQTYLRDKWRKDAGDPATGLNGLALRDELVRLVPEWKKSVSWTMVKARAFAFLCDKTAIDVSELDWFPAFAYWSMHTGPNPFRGIIQARDGEVAARSMPSGLARPGWPAAWYQHDYDHSAPDWDTVLPLGFTGMAERLAQYDDGREYYKARRFALDGVLRLLDRLIAKGKTVTGTRAAAQTASLERLRKGPPVTALDALVFIYLYWSICEKFDVMQVRTLGNLDRLLAPYYRADRAAGLTDEATFRNQLEHFWWQWGSIDNYWGQPVYFGGTKADGTTEYNEVSKILLEVHDALALPTPKVHLKIGKSTPDWVWKMSLDMMRRQRSLTFAGEEPHARVIRSLGYDAEAARTFMLWGCYEWAVRDSANDTAAGGVNLVLPLTRLLAGAAAGHFAASSFDIFRQAYFRALGEEIDCLRDWVFEYEKTLEEVNPALLFSAATAYSVEKGIDAYQGGTAHGNNTMLWMVGFASAVDSLLAVRECVYEKRTLSLAALGKILAEDWKDHEELRLRMLRSPRKWGNNDADANALGRALQDFIATRVTGKPNSRGGVFKASGHTARHHYNLGRVTGATPDGRKKGEELSKNLSPVMGADTEGPTALVETLKHLDACAFPGDFPLDVSLLAKSVPGEKGLAVMRALIERYFADGGLVIQFNVHDAATLKDAQKHPERYRNLQVRVCGWNVRWIDIPKAEQDKFILRQEMQEEQL